MKIVINKCYGGFGLSPAALKKWAARKGRKCYFFVSGRKVEGGLDLSKHVLTPIKDIKNIFWSAYDVPNIDDILKEPKNWHEMTDAEKKAHNALYEKHSLSGRDIPRHDKDLVAVVEEMGKRANGDCAQLKIVTLPKGVDYSIEEYDGLEHIAEKHRTWG